jgi:hypothetical protein
MSFKRKESMYLFIFIPANISIDDAGDQKELWEGSGRNAGCSRGGKQIKGEDFHKDSNVHEVVIDIKKQRGGNQGKGRP